MLGKPPKKKLLTGIRTQKTAVATRTKQYIFKNRRSLERLFYILKLDII